MDRASSSVVSHRVLYLLLSLIYVFLSFLPTQSAPQSALITQIPGFSGTLPSKHYSG